MEVYVVMSRDRGLIGVYSDLPLAKIYKNKAITDEEMAGGRPEVWISEATTVITN